MWAKAHTVLTLFKDYERRITMVMHGPMTVEKLKKSRTEADIEKWKNAVQKPSIEVDAASQSLLDANSKNVYESLEDFTDAHTPQLTEKQLAIFEHRAIQGVNTEDLVFVNGKYIGEFKEEEKNVVRKFNHKQKSDLECENILSAKELLRLYHQKIQNDVTKQLDNSAKEQRERKDSFDEKVRNTPN